MSSTIAPGTSNGDSRPISAGGTRWRMRTGVSSTTPTRSYRLFADSAPSHAAFTGPVNACIPTHTRKSAAPCSGMKDSTASGFEYSSVPFMRASST